MPKRKLINYLDSVHPLTYNLKTLYEEGDLHLVQQLKKKASLLIPGKPANEAHYMNYGLCKYYWMDEDNNEVIFYFGKENDIIVLFEEFFTGNRNRLFYIVMLEDSEVLTLNKKQLDMIYDEYPMSHIRTHKIRRVMMERRNKHLSILMKKPHQRYAIFQNEFAGIWNRLCDKDVCSFLNICQKTLTTSKNAVFLKAKLLIFIVKLPLIFELMTM